MPALSFASIPLRLNDPGDWLGGYSFMVCRNCRRQPLDRNDHEDAVEEPVVVGVGVVLRLLERVAAQVEQQRHAQFDERLAPDAEGLAAVLEEHRPSSRRSARRRSGRRR